MYRLHGYFCRDPGCICTDCMAIFAVILYRLVVWLFRTQVQKKACAWDLHYCPVITYLLATKMRTAYLGSLHSRFASSTLCVLIDYLSALSSYSCPRCFLLSTPNLCLVSLACLPTIKWNLFVVNHGSSKKTNAVMSLLRWRADVSVTKAMAVVSENRVLGCWITVTVLSYKKLSEKQLVEC